MLKMNLPSCLCLRWHHVAKASKTNNMLLKGYRCVHHSYLHIPKRHTLSKPKVIQWRRVLKTKI